MRAILAVMLVACAKPVVVRIDGSSSLYPITERMVLAFANERSDVELALGISGSEGGLKRLCRGEIDIAETSRKAQPGEACGAREISVAADEIMVVVHPGATFVDHLSASELKRIWSVDSGVRTWADVRQGWPSLPMRLYGASTQSSTFEQFTLAVLGQARASRADFYSSEDDYLVGYGVANDPGGLGFLGRAYARDDVKRVAVDVHLDRTLYLYVRSDADVHVQAFVDFYQGRAQE